MPKKHKPQQDTHISCLLAKMCDAQTSVVENQTNILEVLVNVLNNLIEIKQKITFLYEKQTNGALSHQNTPK